MATVIIDRGNDAKMRNNPSIDGLIYFNTDDNCIYLDDGTSKTIFGGKTPTLTNVGSSDGASNTNVYSALAVKNNFCIKSDVADTANNINNTSTNGRPVGCVGFKSVIGTSNISSIGSNVKNAINNLGNRLVVNGNTFYFDYQNGKWGFNTSSNRGADTFHPFNSTTLDIGSDTLDVTNASLTISATTDSSSTGLPIDITSGTCAVTILSADTKVSSNKYVRGGVIHVFNDTDKGEGSGTHAHYMLLDGAWRTAPNKTPLNDTSLYTHYLGLPFSIPTIYQDGDYYYRKDELYYYTCSTVNSTGQGIILIWKYTEGAEYYDKGSWSVISTYDMSSLGNIEELEVGNHYQYTVYNGELHLIGGYYNQSGSTTYLSKHYIWSPRTNTWRVENISGAWIEHSYYITILTTIVFDNKIYVIYQDTSNNTVLYYVTYSNGTWSEPQSFWGGSFIFPTVDTQTQWVVYNGEIHALGGQSSTTQHIKITEWAGGSFVAPTYTYAVLKYPFKDGMACIAPPIITSTSQSVTSTDYETAQYINIPRYIHYMGTAQANPSSGNYRKKHQQIQDTYTGSLLNISATTFVQE